jgi:hypothetical protein
MDKLRLLLVAIKDDSSHLFSRIASEIRYSSKSASVPKPSQSNVLLSYWQQLISDLEVASTTMLEGPKFSSSRVASDRNATAVVLKI